MTAFKFFLVSLLLLRPASAQKVVPLSLCQQTDPFTGMPSSAPFLIAQQKGCNCLYSPTADPAGKSCTGPADSDVICTTDARDSTPGVCSFRCHDPNKIPQGNACVTKVTTPEVPIIPEVPPVTYPSEAEACIYDDQTLYAHTNNVCGCYDTPAQAASGGSSPTACTGPTNGPGKGGCRNLSATSSECFIKCDSGYVLRGTECVPTATDKLVNENCPRRPPGQFFTAVPGVGCVCRPTRTDQWCQRPSGGGSSTCFQSADLSIVECRPVCPAGLRLDAVPNRCVPACADGEKPGPSGGCVSICASTERWEGGRCVLNCADGEVAVEGECIPEFDTTLASSCPAGRTLVAADNGCVCVPNVLAKPAQRCNGPTTAGTGVAKCVMRYDGTDPQCGLQCNNPLVPNAAKNNCV